MSDEQELCSRSLPRRAVYQNRQGSSSDHLVRHAAQEHPRQTMPAVTLQCDEVRPQSLRRFKNGTGGMLPEDDVHLDVEGLSFELFSRPIQVILCLATQLF